MCEDVELSLSTGQQHTYSDGVPPNARARVPSEWDSSAGGGARLMNRQVISSQPTSSAIHAVVDIDYYYYIIL